MERFTSGETFTNATPRWRARYANRLPQKTEWQHTIIPPIVGRAALAFGVIGVAYAAAVGIPGTDWVNSRAVPDPNAWIPSLTKAGFAVAVHGDTSRYRIRMVTAMPGETIAFDVVGMGGEQSLDVRATGGSIRARSDRVWEWHAPSTAGTYHLTIADTAHRDSIAIVGFVLVPYDAMELGYIGAYLIGEYPARPLRGLDVYARPRGFIEVTEANHGVLVSPHLRLGQFLCKQAATYPKYIVLHPRLLLKLEYLLEQANAEGYPATSFHVMSGYRTPYYNASIGNVRYSMHVYGMAADIFIDERPSDGDMDDLNGDGRRDVRDAQLLYDLVERQRGRSEYGRFVGGLGRYRRTARHGPFIHVDVRGFRARW